MCVVECIIQLHHIIDSVISYGIHGWDSAGETM